MVWYLDKPYTVGMEVLAALLLFSIGIALLLQSANWLVDGSASIAHRFKISPMLVGLTLVAFATSLPELVVNIFAASQGASELGIGNVIGANITNILLILGVAAIIRPLQVHSNTAWKEIPFSVLSLVVFAVLINDIFFEQTTVNMLSRSDGIVLVLLFIVFLYYLFLVSFTGANGFEKKKPKFGVLLSIVFISMGLIGLYFGGQWIVDSAQLLASFLGMSERLIGLTVVAIATTLPELAASVIAAKKGETDLAVGNVVGSTIFNLTLVLGLTAMIQPIHVSSLGIDLVYAFAATSVLFIFLFLGDRFIFTRRDGVIMLSLFVLYLVSAFWRVGM